MKTTALYKIIVFSVAIITVLQSVEAVGSEIMPPSAPGDVVVARPAMRRITLTGYTRTCAWSALILRWLKTWQRTSMVF